MNTSRKMHAFIRYCLILSTISIQLMQSASSEILKSESLYRNESISIVKLSPNGDFMVLPFHGQKENLLHIFDRKKKHVVKTFDLGERGSILDLEWLNNSQIYLHIRGARSKRNFIIDFDGNDAKIEMVDSRGRIIYDYPENQTKVMFLHKAYSRSSLSFEDEIYIVDIEELKKLNFDNAQQIELDSDEVEDYYFDEKERQFFSLDFDHEKEELTVKTLPITGGEWQTVITLVTGEHLFRPVAELSNNQYAVLTNLETDKIALQMFDPATNQFGDVLYEHPDYDLMSAQFTDDGLLLAVSYEEHGLTQRQVFDPVSEALDKRLSVTFPGQEFYYVDYDESAEILLIRVEGPEQPGEYLYYDRQKDVLERLFAVNEDLSGRTFASTKRLEIQTEDGEKLEAFLATPSGLDLNTLIVMPHGGPIGVKESARFNREVQYYTSRGFSVLRVNFRGSAGFGRSFKDGGKGEFGELIEKDISTVVDALLLKHSFEFVCAVGSSYGGYSAMMLSILNPDVYDCAVGSFGIYDLPLLFNQNNYATTELKRKKIARVVGPYSKLLKKRSPVYLAQHISVPVLLLAGIEDKRASFEHTHRFAYMLKRHDKSVKEIYYKETGHGHESWIGDRHQSAITYDFILDTLGIELPEIDTLSHLEKEALGDDFALIGNFYSSNRYIEENPSLMMEYLSKAAKYEHPESMQLLASNFLTGLRTEKDINKAIKLLTRASELHDADAQRKLAELYMSGQLVEQSWEKARELIDTAVEQDDSRLNLLVQARVDCSAPAPISNLQRCIERMKLEEFGSDKTYEFDHAKRLLRHQLPHILSSHHFSEEQFSRILEALADVFNVDNIDSKVSFDETGIFRYVDDRGYGKEKSMDWISDQLDRALIDDDKIYYGAKPSVDMPGLDRNSDLTLLAVKWTGIADNGLEQDISSDTLWGNSRGQWSILRQVKDFTHFNQIKVALYTLEGKAVTEKMFTTQEPANLVVK
uniref:prolyl oligopeptidase family serine peptidase n=1 Tax=Ningiella ruwaisensis TaxID=2364274 RepID=UPI0010A09874|nr:prolyl oligopeptidase family serine peptidase [Ningiella ruwaisensis]